MNGIKGVSGILLKHDAIVMKTERSLTIEKDKYTLANVRRGSRDCVLSARGDFSVLRERI